MAASKQANIHTHVRNAQARPNKHFALFPLSLPITSPSSPPHPLTYTTFHTHILTKALCMTVIKIKPAKLIMANEEGELLYAIGTRTTKVTAL